MPEWARRAKHQRGCNARWLLADELLLAERQKDPKSDRSLDQGIVALVVLNTKLDVMHDDFMLQTQIRS